MSAAGALLHPLMSRERPLLSTFSATRKNSCLSSGKLPVEFCEEAAADQPAPLRGNTQVRLESNAVPLLSIPQRRSTSLISARGSEGSFVSSRRHDALANPFCLDLVKYNAEVAADM